MTDQTTVTLNKQQLEANLWTMGVAMKQLGRLSQVAHCLARTDAAAEDIEGALESLPGTMHDQLEELRKARELILEAMEAHPTPSVASVASAAGIPSARNALLDFEAPLRMARGQADAIHGALADTDESLAGAAEALERQLDEIWEQWEQAVETERAAAA
jgi:hypothetical protein